MEAKISPTRQQTTAIIQVVNKLSGNIRALIGRQTHNYGKYSRTKLNQEVGLLLLLFFRWAAPSDRLTARIFKLDLFLAMSLLRISCNPSSVFVTVTELKVRAVKTSSSLSNKSLNHHRLNQETFTFIQSPNTDLTWRFVDPLQHRSNQLHVHLTALDDDGFESF